MSLGNFTFNKTLFVVGFYQW